MSINDRKILIIFETSIIRNPNRNYNEVNFGIDFCSVKKYIEDHHVSSKVSLAVTKFSIDELLLGRKSEFENDKKFLNKFQGLSGFSSVKENFDYYQYLKWKIKTFLADHNVLIIPYPAKDKLYKITKRSLLKEKPFIQSKSHSDYGFKDVLIWESILSFAKIKKFEKIIFICNDNGFDQTCEREFVDTYDCYFKILKDYTGAIKEIEETLAVSKIISGSLTNEIELPKNEINITEDDKENFKKLLKSEYFIDGIKQFILNDSDHYLSLEGFNIIKLPSSIENWVLDDEIIGRIVNCIISVNGIELQISIYLDDVNGVEKYEIIE